jgi:hypothetical protein
MFLQVLFVWGAPVVSYYLGVVIRHRTIPSYNSPRLMHQLLLGIVPAGGLVFGFNTLLTPLWEADQVGAQTYGFVVLFFIEQGLVAGERFTRAAMQFFREGPVEDP